MKEAVTKARAVVGGNEGFGLVEALVVAESRTMPAVVGLEIGTLGREKAVVERVDGEAGERPTEIEVRRREVRSAEAQARMG